MTDKKQIKGNLKLEAVIEKSELLTRYYVGLFIVVFVSLVFFQGLLKAALFALGISIVKYLFDKYVMKFANPYIDNFLDWLKRKL